MIVSLKEITKITVFDTTGRLVYENRPENSHQEVVKLQNGIYLFAIENENTREVHSVIIR